MENRDNQNPQAGQFPDAEKKGEFDSSKQQQPEYGQQQQGQQATGQAGQQPTSQGQQGEQGGDWKSQQSDPLGSETGSNEGSIGQADYGRAEQSDTLTEGRSDVEGSSFDKKPESGEADGFIGTQGSTDTSSELVEDDDGNIPSDGE